MQNKHNTKQHTAKHTIHKTNTIQQTSTNHQLTSQKHLPKKTHYTAQYTNHTIIYKRSIEYSITKHTTHNSAAQHTPYTAHVTTKIIHKKHNTKKHNALNTPLKTKPQHNTQHNTTKTQNQNDNTHTPQYNNHHTKNTINKDITQ